MTMKTYLDDLWDQEIRFDGRGPLQLRKIQCEMGIFPQANGSASFRIGNTKVIAAVYGPHEVRSGQKKLQSNPDKMIINCEYSSACFASIEGKKSTKTDRKAIEISSQLSNIVDRLIVQDTFNGSQVDIYVELIQDDGGAYAASINATTLALVDAGIPIHDYIVACTATMIHSVPMIDLNSFERGRSGAGELTVGIFPTETTIVCLELAQLLHTLHLDDVIRVGIDGCKKIHGLMEKAVKEKFQKATSFKD